MPKSGSQLNREIDEVLQARLRKAAKAQAHEQIAKKPPGQAEYEQRERQEARQRLREIQGAPLADRKEAQVSFRAAMRTPDLIAERLGWLLNGSYGYGAQLLAKQILGSPRMNRAAALTQMVGAFEWQCPEVLAAAAWKTLSAGEQAKLEAAVQKGIRRAEADAE